MKHFKVLNKIVLLYFLNIFLLCLDYIHRIKLKCVKNNWFVKLNTVNSYLFAQTNKKPYVDLETVIKV